jgi:hypothetical protein
MKTLHMIKNITVLLEEKGWKQIHEVQYGKVFSLREENIVVPKNEDAIVLYMHEYRANGLSNLEPAINQAGAIVGKVYPADRSLKPRGHVLRALTKNQRIVKIDFRSLDVFDDFIRKVS